MKGAALAILAILSQVASPPQNTAGTGSVTGRVIEADTREPLEGIEVGSRATGWVKTDANGQYALHGLIQGPREISIRGRFIASNVARSEIVTVPPGGVASGVDFRLRLFADVSGQVVDEIGQPMAGVSVAAVSRTLTRELLGDETREFAGVYSSQAGTRIVTDADGRYTLRDVRAGRPYFILACVKRVFPNGMSETAANPAERQAVHAATFHPSALAIEDGTAVVLHSFEHRTNVNIRMRSSRAFCLEGTLMAAGTPRSMQFTLEEHAVDQLSWQGGRVRYDDISGTSGPDGRVRLCGLPAGRFRLLASTGLPSSNERVLRRGINNVGSASIVIADRDVRDVTVDARPYVTVAGETVLDDSGAGGRPTPFMTASTLPRELQFGRGRPGSGTFSLLLQSNVQYTLLLETPPHPYYVRDITYRGSTGERSLLNSAFEISDGDTDPRLRVTMGADAGRVDVQAVDSNTKPIPRAWVLMVPADTRSDGEFVAAMIVGIADERGVFAVWRVRPGDYWLLATEDPPPFEVRLPQESVNLDKSPEAIGRLLKARGRGLRITVRPNSAAEFIAPLTNWR